jgi:hypothetical protein
VKRAAPEGAALVATLTVSQQPDNGEWRPARPLEWMRALPPPSFHLPRARRDVLVQLALAMNQYGTGWVPSERLQREAGVSESTVTRAIKWAQENSLLRRVIRGHRISEDRCAASTYQLMSPEANPSPNDGLDDDPTRHLMTDWVEANPSIEAPNPSNGRPNPSPNEGLRGPSTRGPSTREKATRAGARARPPAAPADSSSTEADWCTACGNRFRDHPGGPWGTCPPRGPQCDDCYAFVQLDPLGRLYGHDGSEHVCSKKEATS